MRYCSVFKCRQKGNLDDLGNIVTYHRVPLKQPARKLWISKIRRRDYLYKSVRNIYVCSFHFKEADFVTDTLNKRRRLLEKAVPSKFDWAPFENESQENNDMELPKTSEFRTIETQRDSGSIIEVKDPWQFVNDNSIQGEDDNSLPSSPALELNSDWKEDCVEDDSELCERGVLDNVVQVKVLKGIISDLRKKLDEEREKNRVLTYDLITTLGQLEEQKKSNRILSMNLD